MTFAAVARIVGETLGCTRFAAAMSTCLTHADLSAVDTVAIDKTSYKRGHNYLTLAANADARKEAARGLAAQRVARLQAPRAGPEQAAR